MSVKVEKLGDGKVIEVGVTGHLTKDDYEVWLPVVEKQIGERGKVRILLIMEDFHGWSAGALWEDLKFDLRHFAHIERIAMVGEKRWHRGMSWFCKPFTTAKIRYFTRDREAEAREWLTTDLAVGAPR